MKHASRSVFVWLILAGFCSLRVSAAVARQGTGSTGAPAARLPAFATGKVSEKIRLNQAGFYPGGPKIAVVSNGQTGTFYIVRATEGDTVFRGVLAGPLTSSFSPETTYVADFSAFRETGAYRVLVPDLGYSYPFGIRDHIHAAVGRGVLKGFYYLRCSTALLPAYAGKWARAGGHPDTAVRIHPSAATALRPAGTLVSSPGGWYDAGDYNKYIVNCGITMGTLLSAYEDFPGYFDTLRTGIPGSGNRLPDILDEVLWNLRWMLTMQDPADGGVYHKLSNAAFDPMVMPAAATTPRYMIRKGTAATLDFAAVMAQAGRILGKFKAVLPGLSDSCIAAAAKAWRWAEKNPSVVYDQEELNRRYDPDITTGAYGDRYFGDEFCWAGIELYVTTGEDRYYRAARTYFKDKGALPTWRRVQWLGYYTLFRFRDRLPASVQTGLPALRRPLEAYAAQLLEGRGRRPYQAAMDRAPSDFVWGSNAVAANEGILLLQLYRLTKKRSYWEGALSNLDYLLGRNATGYSFVTGFGSKTPLHPHHRPSVADGVAEPVPGLLAGGPNPGRQDHCPSYPSSVPDQAYADDDCAYASNEIAINWNAPMVYLVNAIEALQTRE